MIDHDSLNIYEELRDLLWSNLWMNLYVYVHDGKRHSTPVFLKGQSPVLTIISGDDLLSSMIRAYITSKLSLP